MKVRKHQLLIPLLILIHIILFTASFLLGSMFFLLQLEDKFNKIDNGYTYVSLQHESDPTGLPNKEQTLKTFETVLHKLCATDLYQYYEIYTQPLENVTLSEGAYHYRSQFKTKPLTDTVSCIQISDNVQYDFDISLLDGELFQNNAFLYQAGDKIPVLLGYDYVNLYELGTVFTADYLFSNFTFEVVGFLQDNSKIEKSTGIINLNKYIIMPSFQFIDSPQNEMEYVTQKIHNANRVSGKLRITPENYPAACKYFQDIISSTSLGEFSWSTSSIVENYERFGLNLYVIVGVLMICIPACFLSLYILLKKWMQSWNENITRNMLLKKLSILISVAFLAQVVSAGAEYLFVSFFGLAKISLWGIYCGAIVVILNSYIIINTKKRIKYCQ